MIDSLARTSMPLCMSNLHGALRAQHHLKYEGRQQYGLFLKGIGLTLEDALSFWKHEFSKGMTGDEFDKRYAYNIRHSYGKEGKRANYTPHGCKKIIMGPAPAAGQSHGCPFRHWDEAHVRARLSKLKVKGSDINRIVETVQGGHYQIACRMHFEAVHKNADTTDVGNHPNGWFDASRRFHEEQGETEEARDTDEAQKLRAGGAGVTSFNMPSASPATASAS
jgi:DNA primase large subunit